jgi:3-dehydroquinate synthase
MLMAADLSWRMGWLEQAEVKRIRRLLLDAGLPVVPPEEISPDRFLELMAVDKKVQAGQLRLVLLKSLGEAVVTSGYPLDLLKTTLGARTGLGES